MSELISPEDVRCLFYYCPETGALTWKAPEGRRVRAGMVAASVDKEGYAVVKVRNRRYMQHRLIWLWVHGEWPQEVDHVNGVRSDNRLSNLRSATRNTNMQNARLARRNNLSGFLGVSEKGRRFRASIRVEGKTQRLGTFDTPELAHAAYVEAKRKFHPGCTL